MVLPARDVHRQQLVSGPSHVGDTGHKTSVAAGWQTTFRLKKRQLAVNDFAVPPKHDHKSDIGHFPSTVMPPSSYEMSVESECPI